MELKDNQISVSQAIKLADYLNGKSYPTEDRLLIISPTGEQVTKSGIIIASSVDKKELPRKGVIIQLNSTDYTQQKFFSIGSIVTYGMYAGKEIHFDEEIYQLIGIRKEDYTFTVLSLAEVIYIESNKIN